VEILPGVEGLVHISELADHHVENPSEVVQPGAELRVKILEIDEERRRLSLSIKRVEGQDLPLRDLQVPDAEESPAVEATGEGTPDLDLSEEVFAEPPPEVEAEAAETTDEEDDEAESAGDGEDGGGEPGSDQEEEPGEAHEGESAVERPDSPDQAADEES
jgi:small subunit ribosomal protein S1